MIADVLLAGMNIKNVIRLSCIWIIERREYKAVLILFVLLSIAITVIDDPLDVPDLNNTATSTSTLSSISTIVVSIFFALDVVLNIIAFGFIMHSTSYLRNSLNVLDLILGVLGIVEITSSLAANNLKSLRTLRALRVLRGIRRLPEMKVSHVDLYSSCT